MAWPFAVYANMAYPTVSTGVIYWAGFALIALTCIANAMPLVLLGVVLGLAAGAGSAPGSRADVAMPFKMAIVGTLIGYVCHLTFKPPNDSPPRPPDSN